MKNPILYLRIISLCICSFALMVQPIGAYGQTAQQIAKRAFPSVVLLIMEDVHGQPISLGSGFFVGEGEIASNLHVVAGASRGYAKVIGQTIKYEIEGVIGTDKDRDLVILKCSVRQASLMTFANSDTVEVGEQIYAIGNPQGLEGTFSQGIVSGIRQIGSDKLLQITAPISPGSSGGPVLTSKGEVIGLAVATYKDGQNLNFAVPSNYIIALLKNLSPVVPLSKVMTTKKRPVFSDFGDKSTEGVICENFIWNDEYDNSCVRDQGFTFSIQNHLSTSVSNIYMLIIFYDKKNSPIEVIPFKFSNSIPDKLAKRVGSSVEYSIKKITTGHRATSYFTDHPDTRVEFRILNFEIAK